ncbi:MAG: peptidylprolyl isomerase [Saprospiraceae bacterium]|nr:peptidylprolyl isomerase [Bacteroidia bacterium]NNL90945.1 peptidylprolyl isomerase [Saprospiraceae bacterium]
MKQILYFFTIGLLATACSKPVANFLIEEDKVQIAESVSFVNSSQGAETFVWSINGDVQSNEKDFKNTFYESGRHTIGLKAIKGSDISEKTSDVFITAPQECKVFIKTNFGNLILGLYEETPIHLNNFVDLVENGFYDGIKFHRIMDGFMIQGGDVKTRDKSFNGTYQSEIHAEINSHAYHVRGALAAARMPDEINPDKKSSGTQFYIVDGRNIDIDNLRDTESSKLIDYSEEQIAQYLENGGAPQLDGEYTVFGYLIEGYDVLDKISGVETDEKNKPLEEVIILEAKMLY